MSEPCAASDMRQLRLSYFLNAAHIADRSGGLVVDLEAIAAVDPRFESP